MTPLARRRFHREKTPEIVANNIQELYRIGWKQTETQGKTVYNATKPDANPTISTLDLVADRAKIPVWTLLLPLEGNIQAAQDVSDLVHTYLSLDSAGRQKLKSLLSLIK